jgi:tRNA-splicing ligase RtcB
MQQLNAKIVNFASQIDAATLEQAKQTAALPFVYPHVALMPDAHLGKGAAVGTVDRFRQAFAYWMRVDVEDVEVERINTHHDYSARERHADKDVWLTRKGAVDAHRGVMGVIPGSMGTRSYIVRGKGNAARLCSAPRGAGRRFSRTEARRRFTAADLAERMKGIEYRHGEQWVDEIPDAYKPIDTVMTDWTDLVEVITNLRQVVNVKGT